jgi:M-phase inducer phosphatase
VNIYTENDLRLLFTKLISSSTLPSIIVFHCEFSSERAPRLCRFFRSLDRQYNLTNYPHLSFPSIYLLDGGYAEFYHQSSCQQYCQPKAYISMFEQQYIQELQIHRHGKKVANGKILTRKLFEQQGPIQFCMS